MILEFKQCLKDLDIILSQFTISQDYYELSKETIRANGSIYRIFNSDNFKDVKIFYGDKAYIVMTLNKFKILRSIC